jgi:Fungal fucose-specific lectin
METLYHLLGDTMAGFVSSVSWFDGSTHLRVYTCKNQQVTEQCWDGGGPWYNGALTTPGGTVGATSWLNGGQISLRVYAALNNKIVEQCWDKDRWYTGAFTASGVGADATSWLDGSGALHIRVYVRAENGAVTEKCWDGSGPWYDGAYKGAT